MKNPETYFHEWCDRLWQVAIKPQTWQDWTNVERRRILKALFHSGHSVEEAAAVVQMICRRASILALRYHILRVSHIAKYPDRN